ncbi:hypothetical protein HMPREF1423_00193 [Helicobacter pylori GAM270ASi]|uniref:Uncharacterized protein n=1 Tax=Helicobacter pylori GAM260BSi TaxID=1159046 RepID=M3PTQ7_HELPX|nr:hypothetical protein HMPREF1418_00988 [Helicobacter pylori GAM260BSi]EMH31553.1 hypothetical protein HMPREF1423_00193 [Helicobacter pylori GAM270ASi]
MHHVNAKFAHAHIFIDIARKNNAAFFGISGFWFFAKTAIKRFVHVIPLVFLR